MRSIFSMALSVLSGDELEIVFLRLCNPFDPRVAMAFSSASPELWALTLALRQALKEEHEAAAALCLKVGMHSCKQLREASVARWPRKGLTATDLATLGTLGAALPLLQQLVLFRNVAAPDGVQRLAEGLGAGALPAVTTLATNCMHVGDAGASALAAALGRGALPRLNCLVLCHAGIGDATWLTISRLDMSIAARSASGKRQIRCIIVGTIITQVTRCFSIRRRDSRGSKRVMPTT